MTDLTFEHLLEQARRLPSEQQAALIAALGAALRERLAAAQDDEPPLPSLGAALYEIAQDMENDPPAGPRPPTA